MQSRHFSSLPTPVSLSLSLSTKKMSINMHSPHLLSHPPKKLNTISNGFLLNLKNSFKAQHFFIPKPNGSPFLSTKTQASFTNETNNQLTQKFLTDELLTRVSSAKDADEALLVIADGSNSSHGVVGVSDCCRIINAALDRGNTELVMSIFYAMRSSSSSRQGERWRWSRPDAVVYMSLIRGLASTLRVSNALTVLNDICQVGVSGGEEVPFGKVVRCPTCLIAIAVAQPQHGIQLVSCAKCRYMYELVSGNITSIISEEISMSFPAWKRGLRFLQIVKQSIPSAVHSVVVQTPSGAARTHRFATETVDLPAQEGERVTIALAAPENIYREAGPFKIRPKIPNFYPGEPMCLTNHNNGHESPLLRAPVKDGTLLLLKPSTLFPLLAVLATGDAASGFINPSLPQVLSVAAVTSLAVGTTLNVFLLPQLNQLPQRSVEIIAIKQKLLSQYDLLQSRIKDLKDAAEKEVWMFARMCQLENKIFAVGEPSYRARRSRVKRVREGLEKSLQGRIELINSYAKISSMIEIEVEMDTDVLAAEAASDSLADQIQQIMELEDLEEKWKLQAEANDEAERLLSSEPMPTEQA